MIFRNIQLGGLQLKPSKQYGCDIAGLFNGENDVVLNDYLSDGASFGTTRITSKEIEVMIGLKGEGIEKDKQMLNINRLRAKKGLLTLRVDTDLLGIVETKVVITSTEVVDNRYIMLNCVAPDPFLYTTFPNVVHLNMEYTGGKTYNYKYDYEYNVTVVGNTGTIVNNGIVTNYPVITVSGQASNLTITNKTTGEKMILGFNLEPDMELVIDNRLSTRGVYVNNYPRPDIMSGDYISCIEGDNVITVDYVGECEVTVELQEMYL